MSKLGTNSDDVVVDLIWNMTLICPWDCAICCVDAVHVTKRDGQIILRSDDLGTSRRMHFKPGQGSAFEQAMADRQMRGLELGFDGKMRVLDHLGGFDPRIDFSGGDPLVAEENIAVMRVAAERFGRNRITLTATGAGLTRWAPAEIAPLIGEFNFTYDSPTQSGGSTRPYGYASGNLAKARTLAEAGVKTRAECPISLCNMDARSLRQIYEDLHAAQIDQLLVMRLFSVGRGGSRVNDMPTPEDYRRGIGVLREMEQQFRHPKIKLQCALKFLDNKNTSNNPCDMIRESFGLMADGTLLASPWAIGPKGRPLDDSWVLGNLAETPLADLLSSEKVRRYMARLNENSGHCRIHAFLNSSRSNPFDRIFDSDPMYTEDLQTRQQRSAHLVQIGQEPRFGPEVVR